VIQWGVAGDVDQLDALTGQIRHPNPLVNWGWFAGADAGDPPRTRVFHG
jgi:hypothetical protein